MEKLFCFAAGDLKVVCGDGSEPEPSGSGQQEGESCGSCFCPPAFTAGECEEGLTCVRDPMIPDLPGTCTKTTKKEGESCGSCLCPPTYSAGDCEEGLACVFEPGIADAPGVCTDNSTILPPPPTS